jgi:hypothetical protein
MALYADQKTGKLSVRRWREFADGRFQRCDARPYELVS